MELKIGIFQFSSTEDYIEIKIGTFSIGKDNFEIHSVDQALQIIKNAMLDEKEIWISGDNVYPSMAICLDGEYAAITYFQSEDGKCGFHTMKIIRKLLHF